MPRIRILIAVADDSLALSIESRLSRSCNVEIAKDGVDCLNKLRQHPPDLLVIVPPLLWGSASGLLAVMRTEPLLRKIPALYLADGSALKPADEISGPASLSKVSGWLKEWADDVRPGASWAVLFPQTAPASEETTHSPISAR